MTHELLEEAGPSRRASRSCVSSLRREAADLEPPVLSEVAIRRECRPRPARFEDGERDGVAQAPVLVVCRARMALACSFSGGGSGSPPVIDPSIKNGYVVPSSLQRWRTHRSCIHYKVEDQ